MKILKAFWKRLKNPSKAAAGVVLFLGLPVVFCFGAHSTRVWKQRTRKNSVLGVTHLS